MLGVHSSSPCRNAAETLEQLKSIAQELRLADKAANAKAEELKNEGNEADLPAALRRRNKMRQGVQVVHPLQLRLPPSFPACAQAAPSLSCIRTPHSLPSFWLFAQCRITRAAQDQLRGGRTQGVIEHMSELKALADELLLLRGGSNDAGTTDCEERVTEMCESSMDMVEVWRRVLPKESGEGSAARDSSAMRTAALDQELAVVRDTCPPHTATLLCTAITRLRGLEDTVSFHADLVKDVAEASSSAGYTKDNFAYGSTPFETWRNVMQVGHIHKTP